LRGGREGGDISERVGETAHSSSSADGRAIEDRAEALDEEELEELGGDGGGARRADGCGAGRGALRGAMEEFGVCVPNPKLEQHLGEEVGVFLRARPTSYSSPPRSRARR